MRDNLEFSKSKSAFVNEVGEQQKPVIGYIEATLPSVSPLTAYRALTDRSDYSFLLESAEKTPSSDPNGAFAPAHTNTDRHARFSFVGYDPAAVISVDPGGVSVQSLQNPPVPLPTVTDSNTDGDVLTRLREAFPQYEQVGFPESERHQLRGGFVGFLAYEAVYDIWLEEVGVHRPPTDTPDAEFLLTTKTLSFDHRDDTVTIMFTPIIDSNQDPEVTYDTLATEAATVADTLANASTSQMGGFDSFEENVGDQSAYEAAVRETKQRVLDGDIYQGVISRVREAIGPIDPIDLYAALRDVNPSPYMYLLQHDNQHIVGASPETLVSVQGNRLVSNPIAGTCSRGSSPVEDRRLAGEMLADSKERSEHTMLVDLARNDVRRVASPGSVRVQEFMNVLKYSHVQHIESTVTATLASDADVFDATRATFPAGTLTGAPKMRAMEIIDELEQNPRGVYGGGVGYFSLSGDADFAIVIRTATVETGRDVPRTRVQAGAGIVADSEPTAEYTETEQKMDGVLAALRTLSETESSEEASQ
jgi:anthranilate synthase component 1